MGSGSVGMVIARPTSSRNAEVGASLLSSLRGVPESSSGCCCCCDWAGREEAARCMIGNPSKPKLPGTRIAGRASEAAPPTRLPPFSAPRTRTLSACKFECLLVCRGC